MKNSDEIFSAEICPLFLLATTNDKKFSLLFQSLFRASSSKFSICLNKIESQSQTASNFLYDHVCQDHVKNICQDHVCQDHVCQDHVCQDHVCQVHACQDHVCQVHVCQDLLVLRSVNLKGKFFNSSKNKVENFDCAEIFPLFFGRIEKNKKSFKN